MAKIRVEICIISARGLRRSSSLWKLQWFGVGWVDPKSKYCTKMDASGSSNPTWKTKFSALIDDSESMALQVEVYSREPIFLREKLEGRANVVLKEFLNSKASNEQVGSFQLRRKGSGKPLGFVDVSIRISEDRDGPTSYSGKEEQGFNHTGQANDIGNGLSHPWPPPPNQTQMPPMPFPGGPTYRPPPPNHNQIQNYPQMGPGNNNNGGSVGGPSYRPPRTPPPPPPPSHVGYLPTFLPRNDQYPGPGTSHVGGTGFGIGMGAGALAAGAIIFGDDFMSGFELPSSFLQDASLTNPPF